MRSNKLRFSCILLALLVGVIFLSGCASKNPPVSEPETFEEAIAKKKALIEKEVESSAGAINKETGVIEKEVKTVEQPVLEEQKSEEQISPEVIDVQVEIQSSTSFSVGDEMDGKYVITNKGTPFYGVTIFSYKARESPEAGITTRVVGTIESKTFGFKALSLSDMGFISQTPTFESPGEFTYKIEIFTCEEVESAFGMDCRDVDSDEFQEKHSATPIASDSTIVNVRE